MQPCICSQDADGKRREVEAPREASKTDGQQDDTALLRLFLLGNFRAGLSRLAERNCDCLLPAFHFLSAAGFERAAFVLFHDFVDFALTLALGTSALCSHFTFLL